MRVCISRFCVHILCELTQKQFIQIVHKLVLKVHTQHNRHVGVKTIYVVYFAAKQRWSHRDASNKINPLILSTNTMSLGFNCSRIPSLSLCLSCLVFVYVADDSLVLVSARAASVRRHRMTWGDGSMINATPPVRSAETMHSSQRSTRCACNSRQFEIRFLRISSTRHRNKLCAECLISKKLMSSFDLI